MDPLDAGKQTRKLSVEIKQGGYAVSMDAQKANAAAEVQMDALPIRPTRYAETAERLKTPRKIEVAGDVVGDSLFDGSEDIIIGTAVECMTTLEIDALMESAMALGG